MCPGRLGCLQGCRRWSVWAWKRLPPGRLRWQKNAPQDWKNWEWRFSPGKTRGAQFPSGPDAAAMRLSDRGFALRAGLHCAPLAHESAGTLDTGTVRVSFGWNSTTGELNAFLRAA